MKWPQQALFIERMDDYTSATGCNIADIAHKLGLSEGAVYTWRRKNAARPHIENLKAAADLFGCSYLDFMDPALIESENVDMGDVAKLMSHAVGLDLDKMTPEQQVAAYKAWQAIKVAFLPKDK